MYHYRSRATLGWCTAGWALTTGFSFAEPEKWLRLFMHLKEWASEIICSLQDYYLMYHETIPTAQLVYRVALVMQEYTQSGGVWDPHYFLTSLLSFFYSTFVTMITRWGLSECLSWFAAGMSPESHCFSRLDWKSDLCNIKPIFFAIIVWFPHFQCDPSGAYFAWKATAMGKNSVNGKTFLEKR